jgi:hypothetical protein
MRISFFLALAVALVLVAAPAPSVADAIPVAKSPSSWTLDIAAAHETDGAPVALHPRSAVGGQPTQSCLTAGTRGVVGLAPCDATTTQHEWFLDSSGQIRAQTDPSHCWQADYNVDLAPCETNPEDHQIFQFNADGTISTPALQNSCLSATFFQFQSCAHPISGGATFLQFNLEAAPTSLFTLQAPHAYFSLRNITAGYFSTDTNGNLSITQTPAANGAYWYTVPVPDAPGQISIKSYPSGYCLTESGPAEGAFAGFCLPSDANATQRWTAASGEIVRAGGGPGDGDCLTYHIPGRPVITADIDPTPTTDPCAEMPQSQTNVVLQDTSATLNTTLVIRPSATASPACLVPSTTDRSIQLGDCTSKTTAYRSMVDVLPDNTIRFHQTGNCLDGYENQPSLAAQWPCNNGQNQAWSYQKPSGSTLTSADVRELLNGSSSRILTAATNTTGLQLDQTPSAARYWTFQPTARITQCLAALAQWRRPSTPQSLGLAVYIGHMITLADNLPGAVQFPGFTDDLNRLQTIQLALNGGSSYVQQRNVLEITLFGFVIRLNNYQNEIDDDENDLAPMSRVAILRAAVHVHSLVSALLDQVDVADTDSDLAPEIWSCQGAPAPAAW